MWRSVVASSIAIGKFRRFPARGAARESGGREEVHRWRMSTQIRTIRIRERWILIDYVLHFRIHPFEAHHEAKFHTYTQKIPIPIARCKQHGQGPSTNLLHRGGHVICQYLCNDTKLELVCWASRFCLASNSTANTPVDCQITGLCFKLSGDALGLIPQTIDDVGLSGNFIFVLFRETLRDEKPA